MKQTLIKYLFIFFVLFSCFKGASAQKENSLEASPNKKNRVGEGTPFLTFGISPQYLILDGLKLESGYFIDKLDNWLLAGVTFYNGSINQAWGANTSNSNIKRAHYTENVPMDYIHGYAFSLSNKYMIGGEGPGELNDYGSFASVSIDFRNLNTNYYEAAWLPTTSNGLTYYNYSAVKHSGQINSVALSAAIGARFTTGLFFLDLSIGGGYRRSMINSEMETYRNFKRTFIDYAYNGIYPVGNFTLGVILSK